ncbi:IS1595 family transposase [Pseudahrensia aquimaris]|uniref:IS1595 family transposase n=1 Tax=Pseudahrensia aquimaris TaxID=744461 RepID=A0ABW3FFT7_9HYPH
MSILSRPYFHDEAAAFAHVEATLWPNGPTCPHCGGTDRIKQLDGLRTKASKKNPEGVERFGVKKCYDCRGQFTVRKGTIFEESHLPMHKWLQAIYLMCSSKKGISSNQMARTLEVQVKTAWFLTHRIREAMRSGDFLPDMGGNGGIVEIDETYVGKKDVFRGKDVKFPGGGHKMAVLTLVSRTGEARSFHVDHVDQKTILPIIRANLDQEARVVTDEAGVYHNVDREFLHAHVNHSQKQWGRGEIHTNTVEGYYSIFKRGMKGVYQHCKEKHLHRYLAEYDFRYNNRVALGVNDIERADVALMGVVGKRLTYQRAN